MVDPGGPFYFGGRDIRTGCATAHNHNRYPKASRPDNILLHSFYRLDLTIKRAKGIEPSYPAWEAGVLPMNYAREKIALQFFRPELPLFTYR